MPLYLMKIPVKKSSRHKAREVALQMLYRLDVDDNDGPGSFEEDLQSLVPETDAYSYCSALLSGVFEKKAELDMTIEGCSENWSVQRMGIIDRNVLRIAVYELGYFGDVPYKVVIDEAIELAKRYGGADSGAFVNGVLDTVLRSAFAHRLG